MNQLYHQQKKARLLKADKRINVCRCTIKYLEHGMPKQKKFAEPTEEDMFQAIFNFQAENYPKTKVLFVQYQGLEIEWEHKGSLLAHYCFAKGRIEFAEFRTLLFSEPEKVTA